MHHLATQPSKRRRELYAATPPNRPASSPPGQPSAASTLLAMAPPPDPAIRRGSTLACNSLQQALRAPCLSPIDLESKDSLLATVQSVGKKQLEVLWREAVPSDYREHVALMAELAPLPFISEAAYVARCQQRRARGDVTLLAQEPQSGCLLGAASADLGLKYAHNYGRERRLEDILVSPSYRHCGIGQALLHRLVEFAAQEGCYRCTLRAPRHLQDFFAADGFSCHKMPLRVALSAWRHSVAPPSPLVVNGALIHLRLAQLTDYGRQHAQLLQQLHPSLVPEHAAYTQHYLARQARGDITWVAHDLKRDKIVGSVNASIGLKMAYSLVKECHVEDFMVAANYRRHGMGHALLAQLLLFAQQMSCTSCTLECSPKSQSFYAKLGFQVDDDVLHMQRRLDRPVA